MQRFLLLVTLLCVSDASHGYIPSTSRVQRQLTDSIISKAPKQQQRKPTIKDDDFVTLPPVLELDPISLELPSVPPEPVAQQIQQQEAVASIKHENKQKLFQTSSAALAGFADVWCLAKYGCITNMVTGNVLKSVTAAANGQWMDTATFALFTFSYMMGTTLFARLKQWTEGLELEQSPLVFVAPTVLLLFGMTSVLGRMTVTSNVLSRKLLQVPMLAMGFGVINMAAAQATGGTIFFALTGHFSKLGNAINDFINTGCRVWAPSAMVQESLRVIASFTGGALAGALLLAHSAKTLPCLCGVLAVMYTSLFAWYSSPLPLVKRLAFALGRRKGRRSLASSFGLRPQPVAVEIVYPTTMKYPTTFHNQTADAVPVSL